MARAPHENFPRLSFIPRSVSPCLGKLSRDELCWSFPQQDGKVKCKSFTRYTKCAAAKRPLPFPFPFIKRYTHAVAFALLNYNRPRILSRKGSIFIPLFIYMVFYRVHKSLKLFIIFLFIMKIKKNPFNLVIKYNSSVFFYFYFFFFFLDVGLIAWRQRKPGRIIQYNICWSYHPPEATGVLRVNNRSTNRR